MTKFKLFDALNVVTGALELTDPIELNRAERDRYNEGLDIIHRGVARLFAAALNPDLSPHQRTLSALVTISIAELVAQALEDEKIDVSPPA